MLMSAWMSLMACACTEPAPYPCATDSECVVDKATGLCERNAFCSYPDVACEPGRRWGPFAGDGLADACTSEQTLVATYAACAGPMTPAAECRGFVGGDRIDVDGFDGDSREPSTGYLVFDLSSLPERAVVLSASVELTVVDSGDGFSPTSGDIVPVEPFIEGLSELPAVLPTAPSASSDALDGVALGQTVRWVLEPSFVEAGQLLHLSIEPGSDNNVQYWSTIGAAPPRLLLHVSR